MHFYTFCWAAYGSSDVDVFGVQVINFEVHLACFHVQVVLFQCHGYYIFDFKLIFAFHIFVRNGTP
jgi:hypothetical protein